MATAFSENSWSALERDFHSQFHLTNRTCGRIDQLAIWKDWTLKNTKGLSNSEEINCNHTCISSSMPFELLNIVLFQQKFDRCICIRQMKRFGGDCYCSSTWEFTFAVNDHFCSILVQKSIFHFRSCEISSSRVPYMHNCKLEDLTTCWRSKIIPILWRVAL